MQEIAPDLIDRYDNAFPSKSKRKPTHLNISYQDCMDRISERNVEKYCKQTKQRGSLKSFFS